MTEAQNAALQKLKAIDKDYSFTVEGRLSGGWQYVDFKPGAKEAVLDGAFSVTELREIANFMEASK